MKQLDVLRGGLDRIASQALYDPREPWGPVRPLKKTRRGKRGGRRQRSSTTGSPRLQARHEASNKSEVVASVEAKATDGSSMAPKTPTRGGANAVEWVHPRELQVGKRGRLRDNPKTQDQDQRSLRTKLLCAEARARKAEAKLKESEERAAQLARLGAENHPDTDTWQIDDPAHRGQDPFAVIQQLQLDLRVARSDLREEKKAAEVQGKRSTREIGVLEQGAQARMDELLSLRAENNDLGLQLQKLMLEARQSTLVVTAPVPAQQADLDVCASPAPTAKKRAPRPGKVGKRNLPQASQARLEERRG